MSVRPPRAGRHRYCIGGRQRGVPNGVQRVHLWSTRRCCWRRRGDQPIRRGRVRRASRSQCLGVPTAVLGRSVLGRFSRTVLVPPDGRRSRNGRLVRTRTTAPERRRPLERRRRLVRVLATRRTRQCRWSGRVRCSRRRLGRTGRPGQPLEEETVGHRRRRVGHHCRPRDRTRSRTRRRLEQEQRLEPRQRREAQQRAELVRRPAEQFQRRDVHLHFDQLRVRRQRHGRHE